MRERPLLVVAAVTVALATGSAAFAAFNSSRAVSTTLGTATLATPTNPGTAHGPCTPLSASIVVSWTPTTSTWAGGYEILRSLSADGPFTPTGTATGAGADRHTVTGLSFSTTYYFTVKATKANWRSPATAIVSRRTLSSLCV